MRPYSSTYSSRKAAGIYPSTLYRRLESLFIENFNCLQKVCFSPHTFQAENQLYVQPKKLSPHFSCRKIGCSNTLKIKNLQNVQNPEGYPQKENRQRTVRSSACCSIYFRNRNRIVRSRFRLSYFVTVLIQVSARTLPSSAAMKIEIRL